MITNEWLKLTIIKGDSERCPTWINMHMIQGMKRSNNHMFTFLFTDMDKDNPKFIKVEEEPGQIVDCMYDKPERAHREPGKYVAEEATVEPNPE